MVENGMIYLIQPEELLFTNRYKIGCSSKKDLSRLSAYKKNTRYLCTMECNNPYDLENKIKDEFKQKYKLIAGNEYFEGIEKDIFNNFINIVQTYNNEKYDNTLIKNNSNIINNTIKEGGNLDDTVCTVKEFMKKCALLWAEQELTTIEIKPITLYNNFKEYINANGIKYETNTIHLVRKIGLLKIPNSKGKSKGSRCIIFNIDEILTYFKLTKCAKNENNEDRVSIEDEEENIEDSEEEYINEKIKKIFPNYLEDEEFGGKKQLIIFTSISEDYCIYNSISGKDYICETELYINSNSEKKFINKLLKNKVIEANKIYDFNDIKFKNKTDRYKKKINVIMHEDTYKKYNKNIIYGDNSGDTQYYMAKKYSLEYYIGHDTIINNMYNVLHTGDNFYIGSGFANDEIMRLSITKIMNILYDRKYLRKYIPYIVELNNLGQYYIMDRDYEYIGLGDKYIEMSDEDWNRIYLYDNGCKAFDEEEFFKIACIKFIYLTKNKECLNSNEHTDKLISLIDQSKLNTDFQNIGEEFVRESNKKSNLPKKQYKSLDISIEYEEE